MRLEVESDPPLRITARSGSVNRLARCAQADPPRDDTACSAPRGGRWPPQKAVPSFRRVRGCGRGRAPGGRLRARPMEGVVKSRGGEAAACGHRARAYLGSYLR
eukprot:scaffold635_cov535-Prasinococcus_capsulatus_cf.AAC.12